MKVRFRIWCLTAVGVLCLGLLIVAMQPSGPPVTSIVVVNEVIFVGEVPQVKVTLTAGATTRLIKQSSMQGREGERFSFELTNAHTNSRTGKNDPTVSWLGWPKLWVSALDSDDYETLPAGQTATRYFYLWGAPLKPGNYRAIVRFFPYSDKELGVEQVFTLECLDTSNRTLKRVPVRNSDEYEAILLKSAQPGKNMLFLSGPEAMYRLGELDSSVLLLDAVYSNAQDCYTLTLQVDGRQEQWIARYGIGELQFQKASSQENPADD